MSNLCEIIKHHPKCDTNINVDKVRDLSTQLTTLNSDEKQMLLEIMGKSKEAILMGNEELNTLKKFAFLGEISSGLAHEVKNITQVLKGFTQLLKMEVKELGLHDSKMNDYLMLLTDHIDLLYETVGDFNDIAKYDDLHLTTLNSQDLVSDTANIFQYKNNRINFQLVGSPTEFKGDKIKIKTILVNLIKNSMESIEASNNKENGMITISYYPSGEFVVFNVKDNGAGIPQEKLNHLFEPFHTTKEKGSGVGLNQSLKLARIHRGDIYCEYSTSEETSFSLRINKHL